MASLQRAPHTPRVSFSSEDIAIPDSATPSTAPARGPANNPMQRHVRSSSTEGVSVATQPMQHATQPRVLGRSSSETDTRAHGDRPHASSSSSTHADAIASLLARQMAAARGLGDALTGAELEHLRAAKAGTPAEAWARHEERARVLLKRSMRAADDEGGGGLPPTGKKRAASQGEDTHRRRPEAPPSGPSVLDEMTVDELKATARDLASEIDALRHRLQKTEELAREDGVRAADVASKLRMRAHQSETRSQQLELALQEAEARLRGAEMQRDEADARARAAEERAAAAEERLRRLEADHPPHKGESKRSRSSSQLQTTHAEQLEKALRDCQMEIDGWSRGANELAKLLGFAMETGVVGMRDLHVKAAEVVRQRDEYRAKLAANAARQLPGYTSKYEGWCPVHCPVRDAAVQWMKAVWMRAYDPERE